ncbi:MAG: heavy metal translocating P-type ATPase [Rhodocyclaceae bacterium]|nr:MAG: heavy metal translocating P-type ATPase [Rhodocyclaceae bacterium]
METSHDCYHCGLPIPEGMRFPVEIGGQVREMCCTGCQAVAQAIVAGGHADYYRHRDAMPESPREALPTDLQDLGLFDHPEVQKSFVRPVGEHEAEASLILEGITCAACVWLNESHIARQPGVTAVEINYATRRARVRWDSQVTRLSAILEAIAAIGYHAHPYDAGKLEQLARKERKAALWRLFVAGFGMMQVMMYAIPVYLADDGTMTPDIEQLMRWASLLLTLPVVLYSAAPFFSSAFRDLRLRRLGMDVPVALGVGAAFLASLGATVTGKGEVYFDSVTMFVFFLLSGRYLEMMARQRAVRGVESLSKAMPAFAFRLNAYPGLEGEQVVVADLVPGDIVLVKPGEVMPADGRVLSGDSAVDESLLTGESLPLPKGLGDGVIGGSLNTSGPLMVKVERVGEQTRMAAIQRLMERAATEKPQMVQSADRIAAGFIVALLGLAVLAAAVWYFVDPGRALLVFIAVLVVSCPCALSLATPAALTVATGALAARGLLVARGHTVETLARADVVVFDKTGTLTYGRPCVQSIFPHSGYSEDDILALAVAMEQASEHPLAMALQNAARLRGVIGLRKVTELRAVTGHGIEALVEGHRLRLGSTAFVAALHGQPLSEELTQLRGAGAILVALGGDQGWLGFFLLEDAIRPAASQMVRAIEALGIETAIMSGDTQESAAKVAAQLGIQKVMGGLAPEAKHRELSRLQQAGKVVAMVGDGVNDAPVLAQAQVSVAMGGGTDLARAQADAVLLGDDINVLAAGIVIARKTMAIVRQNLVWAFAYNFLAIPIAMAGWITPWMAGIGMSASSLFVVLNALRLQKV